MRRITKAAGRRDDIGGQPFRNEGRWTVLENYIETAYGVTTQLFGSASGIPWWAWFFVIVALFWKVLVPEPKTAHEAAEERDTAMLADLLGPDAGGKKGRRGK